jgi:hypothetical protein
VSALRARWIILGTNQYCLHRAPVLVAIGLIEYGFDAISAVTFIRERRRGAINSVQLNYLESYKPTRKAGKKCTIM